MVTAKNLLVRARGRSEFVALAEALAAESGNMNLTVPAATEAGDLLVALHFTGSRSVLPTPSGWVQRVNTSGTNIKGLPHTDSHVQIDTRVAAPGDAGVTYTWPGGTGVQFGDVTSRLFCYRNASDLAFALGAGEGPTIVAPSMAVPGNAVLLCGYSDAGFSSSGPGGYALDGRQTQRGTHMQSNQFGGIDVSSICGEEYPDTSPSGTRETELLVQVANDWISVSMVLD